MTWVEEGRVQWNIVDFNLDYCDCTIIDGRQRRCMKCLKDFGFDNFDLYIPINPLMQNTMHLHTQTSNRRDTISSLS